jgi:hypothetical protein
VPDEIKQVKLPSFCHSVGERTASRLFVGKLPRIGQQPDNETVTMSRYNCFSVESTLNGWNLPYQKMRRINDAEAE